MSQLVSFQLTPVPPMPLGNFGASRTRAQSEAYALLARVFDTNPDTESVYALRALAAEQGIVCPCDFTLGEVDREYMDLFAIPGPRYVAPYESEFRRQPPVPAAPKRGSNGNAAARVRDFCLRAGLLPEENLPDHIANELRLVALLRAKRAEAPPEQAWDLAQADAEFRREHLLQWLPELRQRVAARDRLGYYHAALKVAERLLRSDGDLPVV